AHRLLHLQCLWLGPGQGGGEGVAAPGGAVCPGDSGAPHRHPREDAGVPRGMLRGGGSPAGEVAPDLCGGVGRQHLGQGGGPDGDQRHQRAANAVLRQSPQDPEARVRGAQGAGGVLHGEAAHGPARLPQGGGGSALPARGDPEAVSGWRQRPSGGAVDVQGAGPAAGGVGPPGPLPLLLAPAAGAAGTYALAPAAAVPVGRARAPLGG
ncbi:unnamed protein product, partial [Effrenium voratum]